MSNDLIFRPFRHYENEFTGPRWWRVPMAAYPNVILRYIACARKRGMGYDKDTVSPYGDYWDGYKCHLPAGLEWASCDEVDKLPTRWVNFTQLSVEGLTVLPCPFCSKVPKIVGSDVFVTSAPHKWTSWTVECCHWIGKQNFANPALLINEWNRIVTK